MPAPPSPPSDHDKGLVTSRWWARMAGSLLILLTAAGTLALLMVLARAILGLLQ